MVTENADIRSLNDMAAMTDCVQTEIYGKAPENAIRFFESLPNDQLSDYFRILSVPFLFHKTEALFKSGQEPKAQFVKALDELTASAEASLSNPHVTGLLLNVFENNSKEVFEDEVKNHTAQHYGNLFKEFNYKSYFEEAKNLLQARLQRNDIAIPNLENLQLLDQGCGGGRYTTAWKLLGVGKATGIDFSDIGLTDAKNRVESAGINDVSFIKGSVLEMPFDNDTFDIVYSNGVLHHTEDWRKGIAEQLRAMKPGGFGWQYLIENPGGIFWDSIEILRAILKNVNKKYAQDVLRSLGIPMNRVFYMLDHVMVPINTRLSGAQIAEELEKNGAVNIKRLTRGADFDRVEAIHNNIPFANEKFGIGENRFVFNKK